MPHEITNPANLTRQSLKQKTFVTTTPQGLQLTTENRKSIIVTVAILLGVILLAVLIGVFAHLRSVAAEAAMGEALETYQAPIQTSAQPIPAGVKSYPSAAARAKDAAPQFRAVADKYGMTQDGRTARYFQGLTELDQGQNQTAETTLKSVAKGSLFRGREVGSLAKFALADLYRQTGRDAQAIDLYNDLTAHPTDSVPAGTAQMQLAGLYTAEGKPDLAHKIYAQLKDKDAKSPAGIAAAKKLNPSAAPDPQL